MQVNIKMLIFSIMLPCCLLDRNVSFHQWEKAAKDYISMYSRCSDENYNRILSHCGRSLTAAVGGGVGVEFVLLEGNLPHAESLPGGKIVVFSGFLDCMQHEAELAFVLAHELGHVISRHVEQEMALSTTAAGMQEAAARRMRCELEADCMGLLLMARAGYDPRVGLRFWQRFISTPQVVLQQQLAGTHPSCEERVRALEQLLPEAVKLYKAAPERQGAGSRMRHDSRQKCACIG